MALRDRRLAAARLAVCVALAIAHTWPLATAPGRLSRHDNADTMLNEWIVAWVAHEAPRDPLHLFDANIFYPERRTLAFSEHLFVPAMMAAPLRWAGASPVTAYNLLVLAGLALSAWAMWTVVWRWTGSEAAGAIAGSLLAFNAHTLTRLPHVQALHLEFLPFALLLLDRLLAAPRLRTAIGLALVAALEALTSNYLLVFTALVLAVSTLVRPEDWLRRDRVRTPIYLGVAAVGFGALVAPFLWPYYLAQQEQGLTRSLDEVARYSSTWRDYVATAGRIHFAAWSHRFLDGATALFPGVVAILLAAVSCAGWRCVKDPRSRMCLAFGLTGLVLSFGPAVPGYAWLYSTVPLLQGVRGAARFGFLLLVAIAVLAGFGLARLREQWQARRWWPALAVGLVVVANLEALRAPISYRPFEGIPGVYRLIADDPRAIVAEFPFYSPLAIFRNAPYVLNSTAHWRPIVNGYSGFMPESYARHAEVLQGFPDGPSRDMLRSLGVTHVVVHAGAFGDRAAEVRAVVDAAPWLRLVATEGDVRIYRTDY